MATGVVKSKYKERGGRGKSRFMAGKREGEVIAVDASIAACTVE